MNHPKPPLAAAVALALALAAGAGAVQAQAQAPTGVAPPARLQAAELADGEVRKIDKGGRKVTLKHGEIKSLGMAPMAMQFEVRDPALIERLQVGDKIRFQAAYQGGKYYLTEVQPAR